MQQLPPITRASSNKFHKTLDQMHLLPIPLVVRIRKGKLSQLQYLCPRKAFKASNSLLNILLTLSHRFWCELFLSLLLAPFITFFFKFCLYFMVYLEIHFFISKEFTFFIFIFLCFYVNWIMIREYPYKALLFKKSLRFTLDHT